MYQPIIRGASPEDAVCQYLGIETVPVIEYYKQEISVILKENLSRAVMVEPIAFVLEKISDIKYRMLGWITRDQHKKGLYDNLFPMEQSMYSWWCYVETRTGEKIRDFKFIDKRIKIQERMNVPADRLGWEQDFLDLNKDEGEYLSG